MAGADAHFPSLDQAHLKELWRFSQLSAADRALLLPAFERDPSLRPELKFLLRRVGPEVREQFVLAFVDSLGRAPRPGAAMMPALIDTVRILRGSATPAELAVFDNWRSWGGGDAGRG